MDGRPTPWSAWRDLNRRAAETRTGLMVPLADLVGKEFQQPGPDLAARLAWSTRVERALRRQRESGTIDAELSLRAAEDRLAHAMLTLVELVHQAAECLRALLVGAALDRQGGVPRFSPRAIEAFAQARAFVVGGFTLEGHADVLARINGGWVAEGLLSGAISACLPGNPTNQKKWEAIASFVTFVVRPVHGASLKREYFRRAAK